MEPMGSWSRHLSISTVNARAVLRPEAEQGARAWLSAVPVARTRMEGAAFAAEACLMRRQIAGVPNAMGS